MSSTALSEVRTATLQDPFSGPVTIPVTLLNPTDPKTVALQIPTDLRYISVVENYENTLTWNLEPVPGVTVYFENPAIDFFGQDTGSTLALKTPSTVTINWVNIAPARRRQSYFYRLHAVVVIDGILVPVILDPTVHNEPPT
jgi:hypothetical protein